MNNMLTPRIRSTLTSRIAVIWGLFAASSVMFSLENVARANNCANSPCNPGPGEACIFQNAHCGAPYVRVPAGTNWPTLGGVGQLPNDSISDILVGDDVEVQVCSDANFGGVCNIYPGGTGSYGFESACYYYVFSWVRSYGYPCCQANEVCNDWTSSLKVIRRCGGLKAGDSLRVGDSVSSCDGRFNLVMQTDGNLVLYETQNGNSIALWSSGTWQTTGSVAAMQTDGNFVVYDSNSRALWSSNTAGWPNANLAIQNDGNLVVYNGSAAIWSSQTCCH